MNAPLPPQGPSPSSQAAADVTSQASPLPCVACGYNIAGLPEDSVCPECAHSVRDSRQVLTRMPSRQPGESTRNFGYGVLILGSVLACISIIAGPLYILMLGYGGGTPIDLWPLFVPPLLVLVGAWIASIPPAWERQIGTYSSRRAARWQSSAVIFIVSVPPAIAIFVPSAMTKDGALLGLSGFFCGLIYPMLSILTTLNTRQWLKDWKRDSDCLSRILPAAAPGTTSSPPQSDDRTPP